MALGNLSIWRAFAWRGLVLCCCALLLLGQGLPTLSAGPPVVRAEVESENEESPSPIEDDDDGGENGEAGLAASPTLRCHHSQRRSQFLVLRFNRLVHLPHHHCGQAGYAVPVCTPFERGCSTLPLRC